MNKCIGDGWKNNRIKSIGAEKKKAMDKTYI